MLLLLQFKCTYSTFIWGWVYILSWDRQYFLQYPFIFQIECQLFPCLDQMWHLQRTLRFPSYFDLPKFVAVEGALISGHSQSRPPPFENPPAPCEADLGMARRRLTLLNQIAEQEGKCLSRASEYYKLANQLSLQAIQRGQAEFARTGNPLTLFPDLVEKYKFGKK